MIEVKDLSMSFKETKVLKDINLTIKSGEVTGIVGRNGSGKTVLLKCIAGFLKPTSGSIVIDGHKLYEDKEKFLNIGVLIETPAFMDYLNGFDNLKSLADIRKVVNTGDIEKYMKFFELPNDDKPVKKYSLGMRQKLGIIQSVMENQDIILLDEPTNSLDEKMVEKFKVLINDLKSKGKTIVMISHIEEDIMPISDTVYSISKGKVSKLNRGV